MQDDGKLCLEILYTWKSLWPVQFDLRRWIFLPFQQSIRLSEGARKIDEDKERQRRHLEAERVMKERETRYVHWLEVNDDCWNNLFNSYSKHFISKQNTPTMPHPDREKSPLQALMHVFLSESAFKSKKNDIFS